MSNFIELRSYPKGDSELINLDHVRQLSRKRGHTIISFNDKVEESRVIETISDIVNKRQGFFKSWFHNKFSDTLAINKTK